MTHRISIRSYTQQVRSHSHPHYHQFVIPLQGTITICIAQQPLLANVGDCVIIQAGQQHDFAAEENARFMVIDSQTMPTNLTNYPFYKLAIDNRMIALAQFAEQQLQLQLDVDIEQHILAIFNQLMKQQRLLIKQDTRIDKAISIINHDLSKPHTITNLAKQVYLSSTQFKQLFKQCTGLSCHSYISQKRMEQAKALLAHTDTPISLVAQQCGYLNTSAFGRAFKTYFGVTPLQAGQRK